MLLILNDTKVTYTFKVVLFHTDVHKKYLIWRVIMSSFKNIQFMYIQFLRNFPQIQIYINYFYIFKHIDIFMKVLHFNSLPYPDLKQNCICLVGSHPPSFLFNSKLISKGEILNQDYQIEDNIQWTSEVLRKQIYLEYKKIVVT